MTTRVQVRDALVKIGFTPAEARAAVEAAATHVGTRDLEALLRAAKRCPKPAGSRVYEPG